MWILEFTFLFLFPASWNTQIDISTVLALLLFSSSQLRLVLLRRLKGSLLPWSYFHRGSLGLRQHTLSFLIAPCPTSRLPAILKCQESFVSGESSRWALPKLWFLKVSQTKVFLRAIFQTIPMKPKHLQMLYVDQTGGRSAGLWPHYSQNCSTFIFFVLFSSAAKSKNICNLKTTTRNILFLVIAGYYHWKKLKIWIKSAVDLL